jgi:hypothetical protein
LVDGSYREEREMGMMERCAEVETEMWVSCWAR